jgi:hypothetical protein
MRGVLRDVNESGALEKFEVAVAAFEEADDIDEVNGVGVDLTGIEPVISSLRIRKPK